MGLIDILLYAVVAAIALGVLYVVGKQLLTIIMAIPDLLAEGAKMAVDGREIYTAKDLRVGLFTSTDDF